VFEHGISAKWLARAQWAIYVFFGGFALVGLWFVFHSAFLRDVFLAVAWAGVVWGSIGLGIGMHCITQMAAVVDANTRSLNDLRARAEAAESALEHLTNSVNLSTFGGARTETLVAADLSADTFPRIQHDRNDPNDRTRPTSPTDPQENTARRSIDQLRANFRKAIYQGQFDRAIQIGDDIASAFPDLPMTAQFQELRGSIEERVRRPARSGSVG
jgi:hypothetical protein